MTLDTRTTERYAEIDFLRGISVLAMVVYHFLWNLRYFQVISWDITTWPISEKIGASFLLIVGMCLYLSHTRKAKASSGWNLSRSHLVRGLKILGWAALVTIAASVFLDGGVITFGVLHLIGVSIIISPLFLGRPVWAGLVGLCIVAIRGWVANLSISHFLLQPFGIGRSISDMVDYYPIIPWFGVVLIGIWVGSFFYPNGQRRYPTSDLFIASIPGNKFFGFLGQHALIIYLIHQPILFGLTYLLAWASLYF